MKNCFYSQYGQDKWLERKFFRKQRNGFFLEIGADDGIDKSNTLYFEKKGWRGICVEPSPKRFQLLRENRNCICENFAISNKPGEVKFLDIQGWGKGLSGIVENYNEQHKKRIQAELQNPQNKGRETIKVKAEKMSALLDKHNIKNVDFCSIDVEGSELDVLKSIDFSRTRIKIIMVENNYNDNDIKEFLTYKGYKLFKRIEIDDIYVKTN
jgi:FkbM family methyltransferase